MLNLLPLLLFVRSVSKKTFLMTHFTQINKGYKVTSLKPDCRFYFGSKVVCEKVIRTNTFWHTDTRTALQTVCFSCLSVGAASKICGTTGFLLFVLFLDLTAFLIVGVFHPFLFCGERFCASSQLLFIYLLHVCMQTHLHGLHTHIHLLYVARYLHE